MSLSIRIARHTAIQVVGKIVSTILGVIAFSLMTHYLEPTRFGIFTTISAFVQGFGIIADCGLSLVALQLMSEVNQDWKKNFQIAFSARLLVISALMILAPLVALLFPYAPEIKIGIALMTVSFFLASLIQMLRILFQFKLRMEVPFCADIASYIVLVAGVLAVIRLDLGLYGIIGAITVNNIIQGGILLIGVRKEAPLRFHLEKTVLRELFFRSWPIALSIFFNLLYLRMDTIILSLFQSQHVVGLYGAAYRVIDVVASLPPLFMGVVLPSFAKSWSCGDRAAFARYFQKSFDVILLSALPLMIGTYFTADRLMTLISGSAYAGSGGILKILALGAGCLFIGSFFGHLINVIHAQRSMLFGYFFAGVVAMLGYIILIPAFSAPAAAWITVAVEALVACIAAILFWKKTGLSLACAATGKIVCAGGILALFLTATVHWPLAIVVPGGGALYGALLLAFGVIPLQLLKDFVSKRRL